MLDFYSSGHDHLRVFVQDVAPGNMRSEREILENKYQAFVKDVQHLRELNVPTQVGNHPVHVFEYDSNFFWPEKTRSLWCVANGHFYLIEASVKPSHPYPAGTDEVIRSFRILETGRAQSPSGRAPATQTAVLYGTVYNASNLPMPGARVTLENDAIALTRNTTTASDGTYSFPELPPGAGYRLTARKDGKVIDTRSGITLQLGEESVIFPALKDSTPPASGSIVVTSDPPGAQVYLDNAFRGQTAQSDGRLVLDNVPGGRHALRVSQAGFADSTQEVNIMAGSSYESAATLERIGPKPLGYSDVEELLKGSVPNTRVATLVRERGVDFGLSDQQEAQLRKDGADDKLIIAIMKNKK